MRIEFPDVHICIDPLPEKMIRVYTLDSDDDETSVTLTLKNAQRLIVGLQKAIFKAVEQEEIPS